MCWKSSMFKSVKYVQCVQRVQSVQCGQCDRLVLKNVTFENACSAVFF